MAESLGVELPKEIARVKEMEGESTSPYPYPYTIGPEMRERLRKDYACHAPKEDQSDYCAILHNAAHELARLIVFCSPPGRHQSLALTALEPVIFYADAAITRNQ